jgi:hypothetical protein
MIRIYYLDVGYNMNFSLSVSVFAHLKFSITGPQMSLAVSDHILQGEVALNYHVGYCFRIPQNFLVLENFLGIITLHLYICIVSNMKFQAL